MQKNTQNQCNNYQKYQIPKIDIRILIENYRIEDLILQQRAQIAVQKMKSSKFIIQTQQHLKEYSYQIKCYLKLYQHNGLSSPQSHPPSNYEILDQNTLLRKTYTQKKQQYEMYPFTKVFSSRINNSLMSKQVCFTDDFYEGINQTTISICDSTTRKMFMTGSIQQHGLFLEYFLTLFSDYQNNYYDHSTNSLNLSLFATINCKPNQYIDLLTGQRYTYLSKKDVDTVSYKTFYELKIHSIQQYLVALKIAMVRFQQCCDDADFIVWKMTVLNEDQFSQKKTISTGNIVVCHEENKNLQIFLKQVETLVNYSSTQNNKVADHGSLFSCMQPYLRNGKISFIQCLLNQQDTLESHLEDIKKIPLIFMNKKCSYKITKQPILLSDFFKDVEKKHKSLINLVKIEASSIVTLSTKQLQNFKQTFSSYKCFIKQATQKIGSFIKFYKHIIETRDEFYQKQKFPIGLEIKDFQDMSFCIKSFYISKIYSLSAKFQMPCLEGICQKMLTIKNQIQLSLKSLLSIIGRKSKKQVSGQEQNSFSQSKSYIFVTSPGKKSRSNSIQNLDKSTQKYERLLKLMKNQLQALRKYLKYFLNINPRNLYKQKIKSIDKQKAHPHHVPIEQLDLQTFLSLQLIQEFQKLIKTLSNKRESAHQQKQNNVGNLQLLIRPNHDLIDKNNKMANEYNLSGNSRVVLLKQREKHSSVHIKNHQTTNNKKQCLLIKKQSIKRKKKKVNQSQTLQQSLMQVKRQQLQKHLLIRQELKKFQDNKKSTKKVQLRVSQQQSKYIKKVQKLQKARIQSQKQSNQTPIKKQQKKKYQLIYQNSIKDSKQTQNNDKLYLQGSCISNVPFKQQVSNGIVKKSNKINHNYSISSIHHKQDSSVILPEIRSCQKQNNHYIIDKQVTINSQKMKKNKIVRVFNNSIVDQTQSTKINQRESPLKLNKSFLPQISLICKKITS